MHYRAQRACNCIQKTPNYLLWKAVYCFNASSIFICQNPDWRSKQEKCPASTKLSNASVFWAEGRSPFLCKCSGGKSQCRTIGTILLPYQHHCIAPGTLAGLDSTRLQHFLQVVPKPPKPTVGESHLNHSLKGVSSITFNVCSVEWVQPNSTGIQWEHVMVLGQQFGEQHLPAQGPKSPTHSNPISLNNLPMSLPNSQSWGMGTLGLITPFLQLDLFRWFGYR